MKVPLAYPQGAVNQEMINTVTEVLKSGRYILEENVRKFEEEFAEFIGVKHAVAVNCGTSALHLALLSLGVGGGDEVITTPMSFIATSNVIRYIRAKPIFVDVDEQTGNINPAKIEEKITDRTVAILPVHLCGHPAEMDEIIEIANNHLLVVEDSAQGHGAEYRGQKVGSIGDVGAFSFYPSKVMTTLGDGGMLTTNNSRIAEKARMLRNQGRKTKYTHDLVGYNYRMSELHATIGRLQLKQLPKWIEARRRNAHLYNKLLKGVGGIETPVEREGCKAVYCYYVIRTVERDGLQSHLDKNGIATGLYYPLCLHHQHPYATGDTFPIAEKWARENLALPMHQFLTREEIIYVAEKVKEFMG